jgi:hypothetical protein
MSNKKFKRILNTDNTYSVYKTKKNKLIKEINSKKEELIHLETLIKNYKTPINDFNINRNVRMMRKLSKHLYKISDNKYAFFIIFRGFSYDMNKELFFIHLIMFNDKDFNIIGVDELTPISHPRLKNVIVNWLKLRRISLNNVRKTIKLRKEMKIMENVIDSLFPDIHKNVYKKTI